MSTIKGYTDIEQSKVLAKILPIESADMWWLYITAQGKYIAMMHEEPDPHYLARMESYGIKDAAIRCWSLAALLGVLPSATLDSSNDHYYRIHCMERYTEWHDNAIDACYEMILKLHELNLL
jgi:hypothetical protein